jgi:hypothetical protein
LAIVRLLRDNGNDVNPQGRTTMISSISIENFKGIREVKNLPLDRFHVLIGPNASGKSTFLEAIDFVRACLEHGPRKAVEDLNIPDFNDLTYMRRGGPITIEVSLDLSQTLPRPGSDKISYLLEIARDDEKGKIVLTDEFLKSSVGGESRELLGRTSPGKEAQRKRGRPGKNTNFYQRENGKGRDLVALPKDRPSLALILPDEERYPTANAVKKFLMEGIRFLQLNSRAMRLPCPATKGVQLELDGSNFARAVGYSMIIDEAMAGAIAKLNERFENRKPAIEDLEPIYQEFFEQFPARKQERPAMERWLYHLRFALPDLKQINWGRRLADNAEYIVLEYENGLKCPSWLLSDGTLRMLALTVLAFLDRTTSAIYMVEEPENGVHPKALEIILGALQAIPNGQVMVATHSPLVVQQVGREPLLCFSRGKNGIEITRGDQHPALKDWDGDPDLATYFAEDLLA